MAAEAAAQRAEAELQDAKAAVKRVEVELQDAEAAVQRAEALVQQHGVTFLPMYTSAQAILQSAHAMYTSAQATLQSATKRLNDLEKSAVEEDRRLKFEACTTETLGRIAQQISNLTTKTTTKPEIVGEEIINRSDYSNTEELLVSAFQDVDVSDVEEKLLENLQATDWHSMAGLERTEINAETRTTKRRRSIVPLKAVTGDKESVLQYGKNWLLRQLKKLGCLKVSYRETSYGGILDSSDRPDFSYLAMYTDGWVVISYLMFVLVAEINYLFTTSSMKEAIGQLVNKWRNILARQGGRRFVFGYVMDKQSIKFGRLQLDGGIESYWWTREFPFKLEKGNIGFQLWLKMLCADERFLGFVPPLQVPSVQTSKGVVSHLDVLTTNRNTGLSSRGCIVYTGKMEGITVAVKACPNISREREALSKLTTLKVKGVLPLLAHGTTEKGAEFIVTQLCSALGFNMRGRDYVDMLTQVAATLKEIQGHGILHGDVSPSNIVYDPQSFYLIDFGSAVAPEFKALPRTGTTRAFSAVSIMMGGNHCLSSELESLLLVLVHLALCSKTPWSRALNDWDSENSKYATLSRTEVFKRDVLDKCSSPVLKALMQKLRDVFWEPGYQKDVSYERFCSAVREAVREFSDEKLDMAVLGIDEPEEQGLGTIDEEDPDMDLQE